MTHSARDRLIAYVLVAIQAGLIIGVVAVPQRSDWPLPSGVHTAAWAVIAFAVALFLWSAKWLGRGLTALPLPNGRSELVIHGPYRWVRHPIYAGVMLGAVGVAVLARSWVAAAFVAGLVGLFMIKARWEERHLAIAFPGYAEYERRSGRFVPGVGRRR